MDVTVVGFKINFPDAHSDGSLLATGRRRRAARSVIAGAEAVLQRNEAGRDKVMRHDAAGSRASAYNHLMPWRRNMETRDESART